MNPGLRAELEPALLPALAPSATGASRVEVERRIEAVAPEWEALARRVGAGPFLRAGWIAAWWRAFGGGGRLELWCLRRDGRLAALVPLVRRAGGLRSATNSHSPEFGLLAESTDAAGELARALFAEQAPARIVLAALDDADEGSRALSTCRTAALERGFRALVRPYQSSPYLDLDGDWESYRRGLSRNLRTDLERSQRRLERLGRLTIEVGDGRERLAESLAEVFSVEASGWKGDDRTAILSSAATRRFYGDLARWAASAGMLRLFFLRLGPRALSTYYALEADGVLHLLKGGYEAEFRRYSPGKLLIHDVLEHAHGRGCRRVEFHGDAEPYKLRWTSTVRERRQLEAYSDSAAGRLGWTLRAHVRPALKRLLGFESGAGSPDLSPVPSPLARTPDGGPR